MVDILILVMLSGAISYIKFDNARTRKEVKMLKEHVDVNSTNLAYDIKEVLEEVQDLVKSTEYLSEDTQKKVIDKVESIKKELFDEVGEGIRKEVCKLAYQPITLKKY